MSRRFGRNQRRRLREELAQAEQARDLAASRARAHADREGELRYELEYVKDAARLLRYPGVLPASTWRQFHAPTVGTRVDATPQEVGAPLPFSAIPVAEYIEPTVVDTIALSCAIEDDPSRFALDVHFYAEGAGRNDRWAYHVSPRMLIGRGLHPHEQKRIAERVARDLLRHINRKFKETR